MTSPHAEIWSRWLSSRFPWTNSELAGPGRRSTKATCTSELNRNCTSRPRPLVAGDRLRSTQMNGFLPRLVPSLAQSGMAVVAQPRPQRRRQKCPLLVGVKSVGITDMRRITAIRSAANQSSIGVSAPHHPKRAAAATPSQRAHRTARRNASRRHPPGRHRRAPRCSAASGQAASAWRDRGRPPA